VKNLPQQGELTKKEQIALAFKDLKKKQAEPCFELLDKLLKNIIENNQKEDTEEGKKYRMVKKSSKILKETITGSKSGIRLL
jgi:hypothetical protein